MKTVRYLFVAVVLSSVLALYEFEQGSCNRHKRMRTHVPRHVEKLETGSKVSLSDDDYNRNRRHKPAKILRYKTNCDTNSPLISFGLNEDGHSGVLSDRLRGMITTYYLATMTNASFEFHWTRPHNLSDYSSSL